MKKFLIALLAVILALGMMGGAFAYFTDTETSSTNSFTSGTLDLDCVVTATCSTPGNVTVNEQADGLNDNVVFANLAPGDSGTIIWTLTNTGCLPGTLLVQVRWSNDSDGADIDTELLVDPTPGGLGELNDNMLLTTHYWLNGGPVYNWGPGYISTAPYNTWYTIDSLPLTLTPGSVYVIQFDWSIPASVGNVIQGDTFTLDMNMTLNQ